MENENVDLTVRYNKDEYRICNISVNSTILDLKIDIHKKTGVIPENQKLAGFKVKPGHYNDNSHLSTMNLKPNMKLTLIGSRTDAIAKIQEVPADLPDIIDDFDASDVIIEDSKRSEYLAKIERRVKEYNIKQLNPFRPSKKLLVLDIDYTLFDHKSTAQSPKELMRPYLHEFLISAYVDYDIVIWSATSMKWIEAKLNVLGMTSHHDYRFCFYIDSLAMISVTDPKHSIIDVKPLGVIWGKFPQFSDKNTVMVDDVRKNFVMNPNSGIAIKAFRHAHVNQAGDTELLKLASYLQNIAEFEDDFSRLEHRKWHSYDPRALSRMTGKSQHRAIDDSSCSEER